MQAMFTGIVQALGSVAAVEPRPSGARLVIAPRGWEHRPAVGESIAVNGCCLTLAEPTEGTEGRLAFDVVHETLSRTTLGRLAPGSHVNLERSLAASDLLGGHMVQGHIEGVGTIERIQQEPDWRVRIRPPAELMECIVPKGSVTVDGVSLTIAGVELPPVGRPGGTFEVALIPTTLALTTLGPAREGDGVNLETDIMARTMVHWLRQYAGSLPAPRLAP